MVDWISCSMLDILADNLCSSLKISSSVLEGPLGWPWAELVLTMTTLETGGCVLFVTTGLTLELTPNTADDAIIACEVVIFVAILNL